MKIRYCLLLTMPFLAACSLNEDPKDQIEEEKVYTSEQAVYLNAVGALYSFVGGNVDGQGLQGTCRGVYDLQTFASDEALLPTRGVDWYDGGLWQALYNHTWNAGHDVVKNAWLYLYKVIAQCNRSLETLDKYKNLLTAINYLRYTAEVKSLRAIYYWYLLDLYGRVPIVTSTDVSMNEVQQSERSEVFEFVRKELEDVLPYLMPRKSTERGDYYGKITQPVAVFVLAKLYLNAEVYCDDNWTDQTFPDGGAMSFSITGNAMNAWEACVYYCNMLKAQGYSLEEKYENNFSIYNESSKENIWTIPMDKDLFTNHQENIVRSLHYRHASSNGYDGENGASASLTVLTVNGYGTLELDARFRLNYWYGIATDFQGNVVYDRAGQLLVYKPEAIQIDLSDSPYLEEAGARMKKYEIDPGATRGGKLIDNDLVLFRYADVLLMKSEALVRNGESGQEDMDYVRKRANMSLRPATLDNIYEERLIELAWEGWRRNDMIRFRRYKSTGMGTINELDHHTIVFPIPAVAVAVNNNLRQNPGY